MVIFHRYKKENGKYTYESDATGVLEQFNFKVCEDYDGTQKKYLRVVLDDFIETYFNVDTQDIIDLRFRSCGRICRGYGKVQRNDNDGTFTYFNAKTGKLLDLELADCASVSLKNGYADVTLKDGKKIYKTYFDSKTEKLINEKFNACLRADEIYKNYTVVELENGQLTVFDLNTRKISDKLRFERSSDFENGYLCITTLDGRRTICNVMDELVFEGNSKLFDVKVDDIVADLIEQHPENFMKLHRDTFDSPNIVTYMDCAQEGIKNKVKNLRPTDPVYDEQVAEMEQLINDISSTYEKRREELAKKSAKKDELISKIDDMFSSKKSERGDE